MSETPGLEEALSRFESAIDKVEEALTRARQGDGQVEALTGEAAALREDRARLVEELDEVRANANKLLEANTQAEVRINSAMDRIKSVLGE